MGNQQTSEILSEKEINEWDAKMEEILFAPQSIIPVPTFLSMHEIIDGIFLGNIESAKNIDLLKGSNICYVVNCAASGVFSKTGKEFYEHYNYPVEYLGIEAEDIEGYDMTLHAPEVVKFIDRAFEARKQNKNVNILVHCQAGMNRSTTMVVCYLMSRHRKGLLEATRLCRERRGFVLFNIIAKFSNSVG